MKELMMKARSGVTLVELLVVILIVTILSVSLLPLLKPFVVEAQYAAEAIPVIANLRTKIGIYQYQNGPLPCYNDSKVTTKVGSGKTIIETWSYSKNGTAKVTDSSTTDLFAPSWRAVNESGAAGDFQDFNSANLQYTFGQLLDVDNQELVGKRCKPVHFQYAVVTNGATYCYILGCFGDDNGLPKGTGYAVCEICVQAKDKTSGNSTGNVYKQIGTWSRYKAASEGQLTFAEIGTQDPTAPVTKKNCAFCPIPKLANLLTEESGKLTVIETMRNWGWEF